MLEGTCKFPYGAETVIQIVRRSLTIRVPVSYNIQDPFEVVAWKSAQSKTKCSHLPGRNDVIRIEGESSSSPPSFDCGWPFFCVSPFLLPCNSSVSYIKRNEKQTTTWCREGNSVAVNSIRPCAISLLSLFQLYDRLVLLPSPFFFLNINDVTL